VGCILSVTAVMLLVASIATTIAHRASGQFSLQ